MRTLFLLLLAALGCGAWTVGAQENLVTNPGFEGGASKSAWPNGGWWLAQSVGDTVAKVDSSAAHQGRASVRLTSSAEEKCVFVCRKFKVAPGDGLRLEAWVRGENLPAGRNTAYAGLVFRQVDGKIIERHYVPSGPVSREWSRITGAATAPAEAAFAEVHLGYTNGPGTIWYDDVTAVVTNAISLSIMDGAKPWPGAQVITVRLANHLPQAFRGRISTQIGKAATFAPVALGPKAALNVKLPITLEGVGQHVYKISLLDETGATVKTLAGKFRTGEPLALYPPCPCYKLTDSGSGDVLIDARVNLNPARRTGMKLELSMTDSTGRSLPGVSTAVSQGDFTEAHLSAPVSAPGVFSVRGRIIDPAGREMATGQTDVHVIGRGEARVEVGRDGFLRVAGKPEFPIGLYNSSHDEELAAAGFNATHNYNISSGDTDEPINPTDPQLKDLLDHSWANGLRMMVELPRKAVEKGDWKQVRRRIETFRHHPGLLCWGSEERVARGTTKPANIAALYALIKKLDPNHPLVLGDTRDVIEKLMVDRRDFFPDNSMDIGIWWWYPIPVQAAKGSLLEGHEQTGDIMEPPSWLTTTHSKKPLWIAIQAYQKPQKDARFPTPDEYRCEAYLSIINGVKGLYFYCGSGQKDYLGKPSGIQNKPELGHWDYVKHLAGELRDFSPVIMAPKAMEKLQLIPTNSPVEFTTRELAGKFYLIVANKSNRSQEASWKGNRLSGRNAATLFEDHPLKLEGDTLSDTFPPYGVHVYRFD